LLCKIRRSQSRRDIYAHAGGIVPCGYALAAARLIGRRTGSVAACVEGGEWRACRRQRMDDALLRPLG
jgi:hypothetical protein